MDTMGLAMCSLAFAEQRDKNGYYTISVKIANKGCMKQKYLSVKLAGMFSRFYTWETERAGNGVACMSGRTHICWLRGEFSLSLSPLTAHQMVF